MADRYGDNFDNGGMIGMDNTNFSSPGAGNNNISSSQNSNENRRTITAIEEQTLIPVTIAMILNSNDGMLQDGREPNQVKLVAAVRGVGKTSTSFNYEVEDGTGSIDIKEWFDEGDPLIKSQIREEAAVEHQYVRIIGKMERFDNKPLVTAFAVRKLSSGNELTHHFLEVVHSVEAYKRCSQIVGTPGGIAMGGMANAIGIGGGVMPSTSTPLAQDSGMTGNELQDDILAFLAGSGEGGRNINEFIQSSTGKHTRGDIMNMFAHLSSEGIIYSTSDDNHYAKIC
eukprot:CAMPEP_0203641558 /NCGR_PEP_ID=MMETSP0088-20131115/6881_1 /ASSEMBLY_ACC=CAM_ASM_001087 /TAXON_ID=426623 /ORGANISM="Chaetoceros affinis, Strain CCMP159" /LENGTH=283 /DNA_ID=CAMNT_0050497043 /DNA_START=38 /DNA_END=889 /DNA_ORIENTATION=+